VIHNGNFQVKIPSNKNPPIFSSPKLNDAKGNLRRFRKTSSNFNGNAVEGAKGTIAEEEHIVDKISPK